MKIAHVKPAGPPPMMMQSYVDSLGMGSVTVHNGGHVRYADHVSIVFVAGNAADVFTPDLAQTIDGELRKRFPALGTVDAEAYRSDPVEAIGWSKLQESVMRAIPSAPQIAGIDAYQSVYLPLPFASVEHILIPTVADPLEAGSLPVLLDELRLFATSVNLPTDDVELMQLAAKYLEDDALFDADLDVQTYVQLLLTAKQAAAHGAALWIALE
ncbi:MAG TPA: hypothetical protein VHX14_12485 [Thermoanaerobaculia bacterium]|jgi:hypothetical protein|nr:hypothetical protein [Thermoanaerobaculia bacterium]